jgi:hypothetical protein
LLMVTGQGPLFLGTHWCVDTNGERIPGSIYYNVPDTPCLFVSLVNGSEIIVLVGDKLIKIELLSFGNGLTTWLETYDSLDTQT